MVIEEKLYRSFVMKILLSFFIILLLIQLAVAQSDGFYNTILDYENCRDCYFIAVKVESEPYIGKVIVENDDLQDFINKTQSLDKSKYKEYIKDILLNKKNIIVENAYIDKTGLFLNVKDISEQKFRLLGESNEVDNISSNGCVSFVKYFFLGESLSSIDNIKSTSCSEFIRNQNKNLFLSQLDLGFKEENVIINKLFEWEIPVRMDDYSGLLTIRKVDFQKQ